jgi:hypothetical protein
VEPQGPRAVTPAAGPRARLVLAAALVAGVALRAFLGWHRDGPLWLEEDLPQRFALGLWGFDRGHLDLDPRFGHWPHLSIYFYFAIQAVQYLAGRLLGIYVSLQDFRAATLLDPHHLLAPALLASALVGIATMLAAWRLALRWLPPTAAACVPLVLAIEPVHVRHSLVVAPDMLLTLFVLLGLSAARDVERGGRLRDSLLGGVWLGLGVACKYVPALLAFPLLIAHARRPGGRRGAAWLFDPHLWAAGVASVAAFAAASPFSLVDWLARRGEVGEGVGAMTLGHFGAEREPAALRYLLAELPADLGWPLAALLVAALIWAVAARRRELAIILAFLVPYLVLFGVLPVSFIRYLLPAVPLMLVVGLVAAVQLWGRAALRPWTAAAALLAAGGLLWQSAAFVNDYRRPDTRSLARRWFVEHVPDRTLVAREHLGPDLPRRDLWDHQAERTGVSAERRERLRRGPAYLVFNFPLSSQTPEVSAPFYDPRLCLPFDLVVVSEGVRGRFLADSARFPIHADFYRALDAFFPADYRSSRAGASGPEIAVRRPPDSSVALQRWWIERASRHPVPARTMSAARRAGVFAERARLLEEAGRYTVAAPEWGRALEWSGAPPLWWFHFAVCAEEAGEVESARAAFERAFVRDTTLIEAGLSWAEAAARTGRGAEARAVAARLLERSTLAPEGRARMERLLAVAGRAGAGGPGRRP